MHRLIQHNFDMVTSVCALCGADSATSLLLGGVNGFVCFACLGKAFEAVASSYGKPRGPAAAKSVPVATKRCFICDDPVPAGKLVVFRSPFCFCGNCLVQAFGITVEEGKEVLAVVNF
jgi:hypothetical protein